MKTVFIADATLCRGGNAYSFKERLEIARRLAQLCVDRIELPEIENPHTDILLVKTMASFIKESVLSVAAGSNAESIERAAAALQSAAHPRIRIELPVSPEGMEYVFHKKGPKMLEWIRTAVAAAGDKKTEVEFCALDATRAEPEFLTAALQAAKEAGAGEITLCDTAGVMLPDAFAAFTASYAAAAGVPVGVACNNKHLLAGAQAVLAARSGAATVKTTVEGTGTPLEAFGALIRENGVDYGLETHLRYTELHRTVRQIQWITDKAREAQPVPTVTAAEEAGIRLDSADDRDAVVSAAARLGYDLSEEDAQHVYEEFQRVAEKKTVGAKELEAIVASAALQVPPTYKLISYVINTGNLMMASAQITLQKDGVSLQGVCLGDGPIDAAFLAIEQIIGHHYELDDFQIQAVTEGKDSMGAALVKLRSEGKLYAGNGISTDIIGAAIRAYLNAVNKIVYEEE